MRREPLLPAALVLAIVVLSCLPPAGTPPPPPPSSSPADRAHQPAPGTGKTPLPGPLEHLFPPVEYSYQVVNAYPHDPKAFTQGLAFEGGSLFESTGWYGQSSVRRVRLESGEVLLQESLPAAYFGEGITTFGDRLIQLTWQNRTGFLYEKNTLRKTGEFTYATEGWGITHDGRHLIMSDGTSNLVFLDPQTFMVTGRVAVTDQGMPVMHLNELEFIAGMVFANVWPTDRIAIINPGTGSVTGWIDLTGLLQTQPATVQADVLNGIAYDATADRLFVTGKWWPWLFEIRLVRR